MLLNMVLPGDAETARLPKEYQEVEYIQSSGTQYINTGVVAASGFAMDTAIAITTTSETFACICGAHEPSAPYKRNFVAYRLQDGKMEIDAGDIITQTSCSLNSGINVISASNVSNAFSLNVNSTPYPVSGGGATTAYSSRTLYLLWCNGYDISAPTTGKLYYCRIFTAGNLVRDLVPCYRKSDTAVGMYDLVTETFYGNAGTGEFAAGPVVSEPFLFTYTGTYTDNRVNGVGTVRFNSSGTLAVTSGTATVSAYIQGAGGGAQRVPIVYDSEDGYWGNVASGAGGGNQTVEMTLSPGTYEITIGAAGIAGQDSAPPSTDGGNTTAFGYTSTGGGRAYTDSTGSTITAGTGGTPNGGNGSYVTNRFIDTVSLAGGTPNGGAITNGVAQNGGPGYVELTFI